MPEPTDANMATLSGELSNIVTENLTELVEGAAADLKTYGTAIAADMIAALRAGDTELRAELSDQLRALGEVHRIRLVQAQWDTLNRVLTAVMRVAGTLLKVA